MKTKSYLYYLVRGSPPNNSKATQSLFRYCLLLRTLLKQHSYLKNGK